MTRVIFEGREVGVDELTGSKRLRDARAPVTAAGAGLPDEDAAYVFAGDEDFDKWAAEVGVAERVGTVRRNAARLADNKDRFDEREDKRIRERNRRARESLEKFARGADEPITSRELLQRWVEENPEEEERRPIDPFVAWERVNYAGNWIFPCCAAPVMHDWNERISSIMMVSAVGMFCEHTWFGGAKLWLFGFPFRGVPDLTTWVMRPGVSWNDQISSFALFGG